MGDRGHGAEPSPDGPPAGSGARGRARAEALSALPGTYSLALRLREAGLADDLLAECLHVEPEAVGPLLTLADAKLETIMNVGPCQARRDRRRRP